MKKKWLAAPILASTLFATSIASAAHFQDVKEGQRAYEAIEVMSDLGVISGFPGGTYRQYENVTRAQAAILLGRALEVEVGTSTRTFTDLPKSAVAYPYVAELMDLGIFGDSARFYPDRPLTRGEMALILGRTFDFPSSTTLPFTDVPPNTSLAGHISALAAAGITSGVGNGKFDPTGNVTRGQLAIFLHNIFMYEEPGTDPTPDPDPVPDAAAIEATYAAQFASLQADAEADLNVLADQAEAEINAGGDLFELAPKYMALADSLEAETDASFNTIFTNFTAELEKYSYSTSAADKYKQQYEAAKAQWQEELMSRFGL